MARTVQTTLTDWRVPSGQRANLGDYLMEIGTDNHGDAIGDWVQMVNNLYGRSRDMVLADMWPDNGVSNTDNVTLYYKLPSHLLGTGTWPALVGAARENVDFALWARGDAGDPGTITLQVQGQTSVPISITSAGMTQFTATSPIKDDVWPGDADRELTVTLAGGSQTSVFLRSLTAWWDHDMSTLLAGPYQNNFEPMEDGLWTENRPVSAWRMRQLIRNLEILRRIRSTGVFATKSTKAPLSQRNKGAGPAARLVTAVYRGRAYQLAGTRIARFWIRGFATTPGADSRIEVEIGPGRFILAGWPTSASEAGHWRMHDLVMPVHYGETPLIHEVFVRTIGTGARFRGVCAWWLPGS